MKKNLIVLFMLIFYTKLLPGMEIFSDFYKLYKSIGSSLTITTAMTKKHLDFLHDGDIDYRYYYGYKKY